MRFCKKWVFAALRLDLAIDTVNEIIFYNKSHEKDFVKQKIFRGKEP